MRFTRQVGAQELLRVWGSGVGCEITKECLIVALCKLAGLRTVVLATEMEAAYANNVGTEMEAAYANNVGSGQDDEHNFATPCRANSCSSTCVLMP